MKRMIATAILALPLAALCVVPKPASAEPVYQNYNNGRQPVSAQIIKRNFDHNRQAKVIVLDNRNNNNRQSLFEKGRGQRHRQWVAAHYEKVNNHRRWVPGHYVYQ